MMHSVERRFVVTICAAVLVVATPLLYLFLSLSAERISRERLESSQAILLTSAQAIAKPVWDFDREGVHYVLSALLSHDDIAWVDLTDDSGSLSLRLPEESRQQQPANVLTLSLPVDYKAPTGMRTVGRLTIGVHQLGLIDRFGINDFGAFGIFVAAVMAIFLVAIISNRVTIIHPLMRLADAIEATRLSGSRHQVTWQSDDEMGRLARNFNDMQQRLERDEAELVEAHRRTTAIYNMTPAMLFSIGEGHRLTAVSDYWLQATGYHRAAVIGQIFTDFLEAEAHQAYLDHRELVIAQDCDLCQVTVPFIKADGTTITVLITERRPPDGLDDDHATLSVMTDVTALKQAESRNHIQAMTDHLTGQLNRQGFESALGKAIRSADKHGLGLACLFIDLDRFKWINDHFGHAAGDAVLREVSMRIRSVLREGDTLARLGGDEFAILILDRDAEAFAQTVGERICTQLAEPIELAGAVAAISSSLGIAVYPNHAGSAADLLLKADMAMYGRKHDGKNGLLVYHPALMDAVRERHDIEASIELGLREDLFEVYLQPIVDLGTGRIAGFEALMRLSHPEQGMLPSSRVIEIAEETGLIGRIGERVLEKAIGHLKRLSALDGIESTYLALNLSPLQFEESLPTRLAALLLKHEIASTRIVIEITEAVLLADNPDMHMVMAHLSEFGCRIALDDFGTGYSSLSYLNRFQVDIVKIDQSFTRTLASDQPDVRRKSRMLIKGIRTISQQMGCAVVAEGIENKEQWLSLRRLGIDHGQGYLFSAPLSIDGLIEMLEEKSEVKHGLTSSERLEETHESVVSTG
ncbi:diguanylate cyclase [Xaviernesmea oryzae]|uniref:Diguanylate cyclase n=1 Tax=Xaviernesmea oryzae TaxID=464029 RepID=A0A1Q9AVB9_9HYPH|nr:GGDEF and EAL domain-containing protein [Xaviernesmea oryzae]OLP59401.1 diguanylate cyclase [Xaviernesmea oryzae]SEL61544.1 PAS domain S-box-containing protein/diguanylate cyclase (GGDEF) domain-containing protein [Xaviernesmea oryzae]